ncbi:MAG: type VI secretion system tube protein Hcp [Terracidiphilus sp.]
MKSRSSLLAAITTFALSAGSMASAKPVGSLSCTGSSSSVQFNVSYFTFGLTQSLNIGSQSGGAGAGKVTFQPLEVHAALTAFQPLVLPTAQGQHFQSCSLIVSDRDGSTTEFDFNEVAIESLTVAASSSAENGNPARYTDIQFEYGAVKVKSSGGADDGGTGGTPPAGWNQITNTQD